MISMNLSKVATAFVVSVASVNGLQVTANYTDRTILQNIELAKNAGDYEAVTRLERRLRKEEQGYFPSSPSNNHEQTERDVEQLFITLDHQQERIRQMHRERMEKKKLFDDDKSSLENQIAWAKYTGSWQTAQLKQNQLDHYSKKSDLVLENLDKDEKSEIEAYKKEVARHFMNIAKDYFVTLRRIQVLQAEQVYGDKTILQSIDGAKQDGNYEEVTRLESQLGKDTESKKAVGTAEERRSVEKRKILENPEPPRLGGDAKIVDSIKYDNQF